MHAGPPTEKIQQVVCIGSQSGIGNTANALAVEKAIDPIHFVSASLLNHAEWAARGTWGRLMDDAEGHGRAASSSDRNCDASPPSAKKLLGSWPSGNSTIRT